MLEVQQIPTINATFNSLATLCLLSGFISIKLGHKELHKKLMMMALGFSALFLGFYLYYHYHVPSKKFPELGMIKNVYLTILFSHIVLAVVMLPFIFKTFYHAFKKQWDKHKKIAKITFPMWLYVSVTGVIIYLMLYVWYA
ncbi:MAG: DUF420 domain-containing protein [Bacteriovoracaceae bacterium]